MIEEVIDVALEEAISRATMIEEAKRSLREIIASITTEQPATTTPTPTAVKKTPTKSPVLIPRASGKRKNAQPSRGAAIEQALEEIKPKKTKIILPKVTEVVGTPLTSPTKNQKKKITSCCTTRFT